MNYSYVLTFLLDSVSTERIINRKDIKPFNANITPNKAEYITFTGIYCTTNDFKVLILMPQINIRNIISQLFHMNNNKGDIVIRCGTIIRRCLILHIRIIVNFKLNVLECDVSVVPTKHPFRKTGEINIAKCNRWRCRKHNWVKQQNKLKG